MSHGSPIVMHSELPSNQRRLLLMVTGILQLQDLKAIDRVAVQNSVAVSILLKSMQEDGRLQRYKVSWELSHHPCYPSIAVKHVAAATSS